MWCGSLPDTERMQMFHKAYARLNNKVKNTNCTYVLVLPVR